MVANPKTPISYISKFCFPFCSEFAGMMKGHLECHVNNVKELPKYSDIDYSSSVVYAI